MVADKWFGNVLVVPISVNQCGDLAYPGFGVLVPAALWVAVASEGTSIIEQPKGKLPNTLLTEILTLLKGSSAPPTAPPTKEG